MKKQIILTQKLESPDQQIVWEAGKIYDVIFENDDLYLLKEQNGVVCGVDKANQDVTYKVRELEDEV